MNKNYDALHNSFAKELEINDKKTSAEINTKSREELSNEFITFIQKNNCKIRGEKNGKR